MRRVLVVLLLLMCATLLRASPSVTSTTSPTSISQGGTATVTFAVLGDPNTAFSNLTFAWTCPSPLTLVSATQPGIVGNQATLTWSGGSVTSNTSYLFLTGLSQPVTVANNGFSITWPTLPAGAAYQVVCNLKW